MDEQTEILIEEYLSGNMSKQHSLDFKNRLGTDTELARIFKETVAARKLILAAGRLELKETFEDFEKENPSIPVQGTRVISMWVRRLIPVAAMLVLFFGIHQFMNKTDTSSLAIFSTYFEPYSAPSNLRDTGTDNLVNWDKATSLYVDKEYEKAAGFFSMANTEVPDFLAAYYEGMSLLASENPDFTGAESNFEDVLETDNDYNQQALWYKGLCALALERREEAMEIFKRISNSKSYNYLKANEILALNN